MEQIKDWLMTQLVDFSMGISFLIFLAILYGIWSICKYLESKKWNIIIKIFLGVFILLFGSFMVNITIGLGFRNSPIIWFYFVKAVAEGILIPLVFFKTIPEKGKYVALFFVLVTVSLSIYSIYLQTQYGYKDIGRIVESLLSSCSSIIAYFILFKIYRIDKYVS